MLVCLDTPSYMKTLLQLSVMLLCIYIKNSIKFGRPGKYNFKVSGCENIWIYVKLNNNKNLVIGTVYRHPKQNPSFFIEKFSEILHLLNVDNATCFILGDLNININKSEMSTHAVDYTNILESYSFFQLIDKPTRPIFLKAFLIT